MKAKPESILALSARTATKIGSFDPIQTEIDEIIENPEHSYWKAIEGVFRPTNGESGMVSKNISTSNEIQLPKAERWKQGVVKLYQDFMDLDVTAELEKFQWPEQRPDDFNWFVFRPQGLTTQTALDKLCKPQFKVEEYIQVDQYSLERQPDKNHLILCRETIESDKKWFNNSGDDMSATTTPFLDICDRVVLEAICFRVFRKHLDIKGVTLCPRSRHGDHVAKAYWYPYYRRFWVRANHRDRRVSDSGGREAIPLTLKPS